ncbi:MAG: hypothetical protein JNK45_27705 [Myxococcales bacterium]|nr:hypothetical protein [Myxococcales bacterium]
MLPRISIAVLLLAACSAATPEPTTKAEPAKAEHAKAEPTAGTEVAAQPSARLACTANDECLASCRHGAVNRAWHAATYPGGEACEDGCTAKGTEAPRCEQGRCTAYRGGALDSQCTALDVAPLDGPGPAHRCAADDDCAVHCEHGAVNRQWLSWQRPSECGDGCTSPGHEPPRCEDGRCVAYRGGARHAACTGRVVPR